MARDLKRVCIQRNTVQGRRGARRPEPAIGVASLGFDCAYRRPRYVWGALPTVAQGVSLFGMKGSNLAVTRPLLGEAALAQWKAPQRAGRKRTAT
jgi:hypothetical protein